MINRIFNALNQPLGRIGIFIALLVVFSGGVWGIAQTQKTPDQPIQFPHNLHVGLGIQCLYCHPGALRGHGLRAFLRLGIRNATHRPGRSR